MNCFKILGTSIYCRLSNHSSLDKKNAAVKGLPCSFSMSIGRLLKTVVLTNLQNLLTFFLFGKQKE